MRKYLSIHQIKNVKKDNLEHYKKPIIQLMLEKSYYSSKNLGITAAYLHTSRQVKINDYNKSFEQTLKSWKDAIIVFYRYFNDINENFDNSDMLNKINEIKDIIKKDPLKLERVNYKKEIDNIKKSVEEIEKNKSTDLIGLKNNIGSLMEFFQNELNLNQIYDDNKIYDDIKIYEYEYEDEDGNIYSEPSSLYDRIKMQINKYMDRRNKYYQGQFSDVDYKMLTDKLLLYINQHILDRHTILQKGKIPQREIKFGEILNILNEEISSQTKERNIYALKRLFFKTFGEFCDVECTYSLPGKECEVNCIEKYIKKYIEKNTIDQSFIELCYYLNPNCEYRIDQIESINGLMNREGLLDSLFKVLTEIDSLNLINPDSENKFEVNNKNITSYITAIHTSSDKRLVSDVIKAVQKNGKILSQLFDADEMVNTSITSEGSIWNRAINEISCEDIEDKDKFGNPKIIIKDENENSICVNKRPQLISAEAFIKRCKAN